MPWVESWEMSFAPGVGVAVPISASVCACKLLTKQDIKPKISSNERRAPETGRNFPGEVRLVILAISIIYSKPMQLTIVSFNDSTRIVNSHDITTAAGFTRSPSPIKNISTIGCASHFQQPCDPRCVNELEPASDQLAAGTYRLDFAIADEFHCRRPRHKLDDHRQLRPNESDKYSSQPDESSRILPTDTPVIYPARIVDSNDMTTITGLVC